MRKTFIERVLTKRRKPGKGSRRRPAAGLLASLSRVPPSTRVIPWYRADSTDMRWLPINEDIELPSSSPAPVNLLERLVEEASHRVVFRACGCRVSCECDSYPHDIGCMLMGDQAIESPGSVSREVGPAEAKEHVRRAVESGLVPMVGKARVDNFIFGVKDRRRMMTCCFCCDCCCISRYERYFPVGQLDQMFPRLDGAKIVVTSDCDGCASREAGGIEAAGGNVVVAGSGQPECLKRCYIQAIGLDADTGRALVGDRCRACGRCALACPRHAIEVRIEEEAFLEKSYERILAHVDHT